METDRPYRCFHVRCQVAGTGRGFPETREAGDSAFVLVHELAGQRHDPGLLRALAKAGCRGCPAEPVADIHRRLRAVAGCETPWMERGPGCWPCRTNHQAITWNSAPTAAVIAMASTPQNATRSAPLAAEEPPTLAATAPSTSNAATDRKRPRLKSSPKCAHRMPSST